MQNIKDNIGVIPFNNNSTAWWICHFIKQGNLEPVLHNGKLVFKVDTIIYLLKNHGPLNMYIVILKHHYENKRYFIEVWESLDKRFIYGFDHSKLRYSGLTYPLSYAKHYREIIAYLKKHYILLRTKDVAAIHKRENLWQGGLASSVTKYQYEVIGTTQFSENPLEYHATEI